MDESRFNRNRREEDRNWNPLEPEDFEQWQQRPEFERPRRYRGDNYIRGIHEESDFSFGSEYVQDERAFRPSRLSQPSGSRSWINVGNSAHSGDVGGREYTSSEYSENPSYYDGDTGRGPNNYGKNPSGSAREEIPFGMSSYPQYFKKSFAGRGPKGYQRSDASISEDINERLTHDHDIDPTGITVEVKDGEVMLKGLVTDREQKLRAEEIAEACSGVKDVYNLLRIQPLQELPS